MLEVSRVGVAESDEEIELSLELSIGGSYGKCEKEMKMVDSSSPCKEDERVVENNNNVVIPRSGFSFSEAESGGSGSEAAAVAAADPNMKREIQALRRKEARKKREEKLRKSAVNFKGINDKVFLEAQEQQLQARARDREMREKETVQDFPSAQKNDNIVTNEGVNPKFDTGNIINQKFRMTQMRGVYPQEEECMGLKNGSLYPYGAPCFVGPGIAGKEENGLKAKTMFQPGSFRPYVNGNGGDMNMRNNSRTGFVDSGQNNGMSRIVSQKALSNGSMERSSSAISDYRSTSGKGGSISDTGSHSSYLQGNDRQFTVSAGSHDLKQPDSDSSLNRREAGKESVRAENSPKKMSVSKEAQHFTVNATRTIQPDTKSNAATSKLKVTTADPLKKASELTENPSKIQPRNPSMPSLPQMPCVSTTGNGPNGKTVTGFLYRYTKTEVSIVCVCHGISFSPAEFVEHAGGIDITHPLRHITMIPSFFG